MQQLSPGSSQRRRSRCRHLVAGLIAALVASTAWVSPAPAQVAEPDDATLGRTAAAAAVSCWDIKQRDAGASDGAYWLLTPAMPAPRQFHCDMTTDGGGWVLIGRGRDGWQFSYNGHGNHDEVHDVVDGPGAFTPRELPATTIDGLLDGGRPDQLVDGVRLRRATTTDGSGRQEVRFDLARQDRWVWTFDAPHEVGSFRFDASAGSGGTTDDFGQDQRYRRVRPVEMASHAYRMGWGFGSDVVGVNDASSYLWSNAGEGNALPFTQVFLRPRLTAANTSFAAIPDAGAPAEAQRPLLSNRAEPGEWGVTGRANGLTSELNVEVQAFAESGGRMLVGGNFRHVQQGAGGTQHEQPYLAAFDVGTGAWIPDFRPVLDGQVKDLHILADGTVVAAGEFTTVNGEPSVGVVALDPVTGEVDPSWQLDVESRLDGAPVAVFALDAEGPWLYLAGRFTHLTGGTRPDAVYARMGARVSLADGTPDADWNPLLDGTAVDVHASPRGDRVYFAGYFSQADGDAAERVAVLTSASGAAVVPGLEQPTFSSRVNYQQAVREVGDRVWYGGSEHNLFSADRETFSLLSGNITRRHGDFQVIDDRHGVVYGGCHCDDFTYSDSYEWNWNFVIPGWSQADNIRYVGAWDAASGNYLPEFVPGVDTSRGQGTWELSTDSNGTTWMGGDFSRSQTTGGRWQWAGGFVRFAERDSVAPTRPGTLSGAHDAGTTTLSWGASTDDRGTVRYEVLRHDRVIATTWGRQLSIADPGGGTRFFVRALDAAGNRSATTAVHVSATSPPPTTTTTTTVPPTTTTTTVPPTTTTTTVPPTTPPAGSPFTDIVGNVHAPLIDAIAAEGITLGCNPEGTRYCPGRTVSREQMASFLARAFGLPPATRDHFDDDSTSSHQENINRLAESGIARGTGDRRFSPGAPVSREQMATFLTNALGLIPLSAGPFTDVAGIHAPNVNAVAAEGITLGCNEAGTRYCPGASVRRDQMASFLGRALDLG